MCVHWNLLQHTKWCTGVVPPFICNSKGKKPHRCEAGHGLAESLQQKWPFWQQAVNVMKRRADVPAEQRDPQVVFEDWIQDISLKTALQLLTVPKTESRQHRDAFIMIPVECGGRRGWPNSRRRWGKKKGDNKCVFFPPKKLILKPRATLIWTFVQFLCPYWTLPCLHLLSKPCGDSIGNLFPIL